MSPNQITDKKATINPKNEKDNKCFQWSIIPCLNYNKIKEKKVLKFKRVDTDFSSYQRDQEEFEQNNNSIVVNILFVSYDGEKIKIAYKSINGKANNYHYFAVKNLSELNFLG